MLNAKEKAKEILLKYRDTIDVCEGTGTWDDDTRNHHISVKAAAELAVDCVIDHILSDRHSVVTDFLSTLRFWKEVKEEVKNYKMDEL